jgi:CheY-like chemotaxis protein
MNNAMKFTESGHVELGTLLENENLCIYVRDTGIGISREDIKHLFERFRKIEVERSVVARGVGLGLAISRKIADLLGGKITVESEPAVGTLFKVCLPYASFVTQKKVNITEAPNRELRSWNDKNILVVEDEEANYIYLKKALAKTKANIVWARNGLEAVKLFEETAEFDLVLMDIKMPQMDGFEATMRIKAMKPNQLIIAQTAYARPEDKHKFSLAGFDDYILKPVKQIDLISLLEKHL